MTSRVAILLCTYQGEAYLTDQLESFSGQSFSDWALAVSDDGSADATPRILDAYARRLAPGRVAVRRGPQRGFVVNFMSLLFEPGLHADYYALSDQDDIWHADKLERAVRWLDQVPVDQPALYCTRTELVDAEGRHLEYSPHCRRPAQFGNAIVQNVAGGNTMVINEAARRLLAEQGADVKVFAHDWWIYIVISACGGLVHFDDKPSLQYRQHGNNQIGAGFDFGARFRRIGKIAHGHLQRCTDQHLSALQPYLPKLTPANRRVYDRFVAARKRSMLPRLIGISRAGIYRQTKIGALGLLIAALFNRI